MRDGGKGRVCQSYRTNKSKKSSKRSFLTGWEPSMVPSLFRFRIRTGIFVRLVGGQRTCFSSGPLGRGPKNILRKLQSRTDLCN